MLKGRKSNAAAITLLVSLCCDTSQQHLLKLCIELFKKGKGKK